MEKSHFDAYGEAAEQVGNLTVVSGRYAIQETAERNIVLDVVDKLRLKSTDDLLEIGCGVGNLLIPLSFLTNSVYGIDHPSVVSTLNSRFSSHKITLIGEDFFDTNPDQKFDKILIYSVLVVMPDEDTLYRFIDKACELLKPDGRMLLGDINCTGRKKRFLSSDVGKAFTEQWEKQRRKDNSDAGGTSKAPCVPFTDELVMQLMLYLRRKGFHSYLCEQPNTLPFGNTREDIIAVGPEHV